MNASTEETVRFGGSPVLGAMVKVPEGVTRPVALE